MAEFESLGNDNSLETDGAPIPPMHTSLFHTRSETGVENSKHLMDNRVDSGVGSLNMKSLCLSNLSSVIEDKMPVQCTDESEQEYRLESKFQSMSVDDEGIYSMSREQSMETPIEVDVTEVDEDGDNIFHRAILCEDLPLSLALIDLVEDVELLNLPNVLHQAPIHLAVLTKQYEITQKLVDRKVDVTVRDHLGNTPLHIACRVGDQDAVRIIVESFGKDVSARKKYFALKNSEGLTCLHVASLAKEYIIMGHLFSKGADVNMGDAKSGRTVLHYAVEQRDVTTVCLLLTHSDIDVDRKTFKGETPLVMAYWRNYREIVKRLKSKGAYFSYDVVEDSDEDYLS